MASLSVDQDAVIEREQLGLVSVIEANLLRDLSALTRKQNRFISGLAASGWPTCGGGVALTQCACEEQALPAPRWLLLPPRYER